MAASSVIGNLAVNLSMETAAFQRGATIAEKRIGEMQKRLIGIGKKVAAAGTIMTAGLTLPLVAFGQKAFKAASDAAELDSAFVQTFGKMSASMDKWAEATGNAMGRSTREIKEGANTFGLYFNQAAKTRAEAAKMSQTFTVLAQDLASFHNTGVEDAILALRSGLSGEAEPMRKFGVFLSEAVVAAKAAELGLGGLGRKLTDQEKIMARYAIIMEKTKSAQGDVGRTSESTANQIRRSQAAWEELQITVGTKLLPVLTPIIEKLGNILEFFSRLSPATQTWVVGIGAAAVALGPLVTVTGGLIAATGALLPLLMKLGPLFTGLGTVVLAFSRTLMVLAIAGGPITLTIAAAGALYLAFKNWDAIKGVVQSMVTGVADALRGMISGPLAAAKTAVNGVTNTFKDMWNRVVGNSYVPDMVDGIAAEMARLPAVMVMPAVNAVSQTAAAFADWASTVPQNMSQVRAAITDIGLRGFDGIADGIAGAIAGTQSLADAFRNMAQNIIQDLVRMIIKMLIFRAISGMIGGGFGSASLNALPMSTNLPNTDALPKLASGGTFGGFGGVDRNTLSLNGTPIARVSRGENFNVTPANSNQGGPIEVRVMVDASPDLMVKAAVMADSRIRAATPQIVRSAANATLRAAGRPKLMGRS